MNEVVLGCGRRRSAEGTALPRSPKERTEVVDKARCAPLRIVGTCFALVRVGDQSSIQEQAIELVVPKLRQSIRSKRFDCLEVGQIKRE